jgi:hypothetical protein
VEAYYDELIEVAVDERKIVWETVIGGRKI